MMLNSPSRARANFGGEVWSWGWELNQYITALKLGEAISKELRLLHF